MNFLFLLEQAVMRMKIHMKANNFFLSTWISKFYLEHTCIENETCVETFVCSDQGYGGDLLEYSSVNTGVV
jgi:hypothetical protein